MQQSNKIKITQKDFDDLYEIEGITEETEVNPTPEPEISDEQDTTPLTKEELKAQLDEHEQLVEDEYVKDFEEEITE